MKKFLLLIVTLFTLTANSQTSVYHPFPDSNAVWNIDSYQNCGLGFDYWQHLYSIIISGDTTISNVIYHKLEVPIEVIISNGMCLASGTWTMPGYYLGSIRQDTSIRKVFFVPPLDSIEQLLYDFNMQVGDTVKGFTGSFIGQADIVQSIDSVLVGSDYRKRWIIAPCYGIYFIEGIGSTYGLIEKSPGCATDQNSYLITCFKQNSISLYPDTVTTCNLITGVKNILYKPFFTTISPNPFHTLSLLEVSSEFETAELKIYNTLGMLLKEERILHQKSIMLNRDKLSNGIYFLQLTNENGETIIEKFMVE